MGIIPAAFPGGAGWRAAGTHKTCVDTDELVRNYPVYIAGYRLEVRRCRHASGANSAGPNPHRTHAAELARQTVQLQVREFCRRVSGHGPARETAALDEFKARSCSSVPPQQACTTCAPPDGAHAPRRGGAGDPIDNSKHGDSLRFPEGRHLYLLITLAIIWATAWAFIAKTGAATSDKLFGLSQVILIGSRLASINFSNIYITWRAVLLRHRLLTLARLYATATGKALEQNMVRAATARAGDCRPRCC